MQGVLTTVGDCIGPDEPVHVPMIPAWISLGDHDSILYYRNLGHLYPQAIVEPSSIEDVAEDCFAFGPGAFSEHTFKEEALEWPHHDPAKHGPIDPDMDRDEASLVLNSVLLDLPAGSQIDLRAYNLQSDYSDLPLATQHFRLRVALDTATPQKTMHEVIFGDHRETPTKRIWLPGGDDYGDYQPPGMEIGEPQQHLATPRVRDAVGRLCRYGFPVCTPLGSPHYFDTGLRLLRFDKCAADAAAASAASTDAAVASRTRQQTRHKSATDAAADAAVATPDAATASDAVGGDTTATSPASLRRQCLEARDTAQCKARACKAPPSQFFHLDAAGKVVFSAGTLGSALGLALCARPCWPPSCRRRRTPIVRRRGGDGERVRLDDRAGREGQGLSAAQALRAAPAAA